MFTPLINEKKLAKISTCSLELPRELVDDDSQQATKIKETTKALKVRMALNTRDFARYLHFYVSKDLTTAIKRAPLIKASELHRFRKVKLSDTL